jgi:hypothetical protein
VPENLERKAAFRRKPEREESKILTFPESTGTQDQGYKGPG